MKNFEDEYYYYEYWSEMSEKKDLSEDFIWGNWEHLQKSEILRARQYSQDLLEKLMMWAKRFPDVRSDILWRQKLSRKILEKHTTTFTSRDWDIISATQDLPENFIERHEDHLNWLQISRNQKLSLGFMRTWKHKLTWSCVCVNEKIDPRDIIELEDEVDCINWKALYERLG